MILKMTWRTKNRKITLHGLMCSHCVYYLYKSYIQPAGINECELEMHTCHVNANCTDTIGSFMCTCGEGFEGDGITCTGKNL